MSSLLDPVSPELKLVRLDGMDAELGLLAGLDPLGPGVAEQAVGQQAELIGRLSRRDLHAHALGPEAGLLERDLVSARRQVDVDRARRPRAGLHREGFFGTGVGG